MRRIVSVAARGLSFAIHSKMLSRSASASGRMNTPHKPKRLRRASNSSSVKSLALASARLRRTSASCSSVNSGAAILLLDKRKHCRSLALPLARPAPHPLKNDIQLFVVHEPNIACLLSDASAGSPRILALR